MYLLICLFTFVELNCENLFDTQHDSLKHDEEFLPASAMHWTPSRYWHKLNRIGQDILSCGELDTTKVIPDMVVLTEVENDSVMRDLTKRSLLRNAGYEYVMTDSPRRARHRRRPALLSFLVCPDQLSFHPHRATERLPSLRATSSMPAGR
jgi:hypothetical protein